MKHAEQPLLWRLNLLSIPHTLKQPEKGFLNEFVRIGRAGAYVHQVAAFARHFNKSPMLLGPEDIRTYQVYLTRERKLSASSLIVVTAALRFLYKVTLQKPWGVDLIPRPKTPQKLPVILSPEEVAHFLEGVAGVKQQAILTTAYAILALQEIQQDLKQHPAK